MAASRSTSIFPQQTSCILLQCYHKNCTMAAHITCLATRLCEDGHILPVAGQCPSCSQELLWGELIRRYRSAAERKKEVRWSLLGWLAFSSDLTTTMETLIHSSFFEHSCACSMNCFWFCAGLWLTTPS